MSDHPLAVHAKPNHSTYTRKPPLVPACQAACRLTGQHTLCI